jgi:carbon-monoxide dehydrogenase large subunit
MNAFRPSIGQPIERVEDLRLLRGAGRFVDDITCPAQLHAVVLRSAVAHGIIRRIDVSAALGLRGVHAVLTAADIGSVIPTIPVRLFPMPEHVPFQQPVMAFDRVRYVGEPLAVVIADSPALGEDALDLIDVEIDPLPPVVDRDAEENCALHYRAWKGDAGACFAAAAYRRREVFHVHRHTGITMEARGVLAQWDAARGHMTVWGAAKVPFANRRILADMLSLPHESVDMIEGDAGGSFGVRGEFFPEDFLIPFAARRLGRPVKWIEDRREHFLTISHAREASCEIEIACRGDGTILGLRGKIWADVGAYLRTTGVIGPRNVGQFIAGPYDVADIDFDIAVQLSNKSPCGTYRGPGRFEGDFFRERMVDLAAGDLGIDPVTFRRRNLVAEGRMPYQLASIAPTPVVTELDSGAYEIVLDRCLAEARWFEKMHLQGKPVDGSYHGLAVGCFIEGGAAGPKECARLAVEPDGGLSVYVGSSAVGQGVETILGQIAADSMEMPFEKIRVLHGSTTYLREGFGSYHSRSTVMGGSAILAASDGLRRKILEAAALRLNCAATEVSFVSGIVTAPDGRRLSLAELWHDDLAFEAAFANHHHTYAYGCHVAHVAVDVKTGHVQLVDYVAVEDAGRIINPLTLHGQAIGAIVQGLGGTFLENLIYDGEGQLLTASFADYLLPLATDFPSIRATTLELRRSPRNPLGAKGAGEGGIIPVGGVIANAIAAALASFGVQPKELPVSPPKIWALLQQAQILS